MLPQTLKMAFILILSAAVHNCYSMDVFPATAALQIEVDDKSKVCSIVFSNTSKVPISIVNSFDPKLIAQTKVPPFTLVYVRRRGTKEIVSGPLRKDGGYTPLIFRSQLDKWTLSEVSPGAELKFSFPIKDIILGLFDHTGTSQKSLAEYEVQFRTSVFFDLKMTSRVDAETKWLPAKPLLKNE